MPLLLALIILGLAVGCGRPARMPEAINLTSQKGQSLDFEILKSSIFAPKCMACHSVFSSYESFMTSGMVVVKNPEASPLYLKVASGQMPIGGTPLSDTETKAIYDWISGGAIKSGGGINSLPPVSGTLPPPPVVPPADSTVASPTFAWIQTNIFVPRCAICHQGTNAPAGYNLTSYDSVLSGGRVLGGNPSGSLLLQRINDNSMPPGNPLTAEMKMMITQWIQNGAQNDAPAGGLPPVTSPPLPPVPPLEPNFNSIMANIIAPRCLACHDSIQRKGGVILQNYNSLMEEVRAGNAADSKLYEVVQKNEMPTNGPALNFEEKETIRLWINAGAKP